MDSTGALELADVPRRLLVVGGGIIGLEMAAIYHALGSRITIVERLPQLLPGADPDLVQPLARTIAARYEAIHLATEMQFVAATPEGLRVRLVGAQGSTEDVFDRILVAVGDEVKAGQGIVVMEAMKMQNEMKSPKDGKVQKILTSAGSTVNPGDTLAIIE